MLAHVLPLLALHTEDEALLAVVGDEGLGLGVFALHGGDVPEADDVAAGIGVDHRVLHIVNLVERVVHVDGRLVAVVLEASGSGDEALGLELMCDEQIADAVVGELVAVDVDADLVLLQTEDAHLAHTGNHAQGVDELVHVVVELAIGLILRFHREQQRRGVAEVVVDLNGQHALGQRVLEALHAVFELRPEGVLVRQLVVELHADDGDAVLGEADGLLLLHFLVGENVFLQRLGHLLLHILHRDARIDGDDEALTDGEIGEFVLVDVCQAVDAHRHKAAHEQDDDLPVVHRPLLQAHLFLLILFHNSKSQSLTFNL